MVSLGTDDGVYPGDRLESGTPYELGRLEVVTASADQSVTRIVSEHEGLPIKVGDSVIYGRTKWLAPPSTRDDTNNDAPVDDPPPGAEVSSDAAEVLSVEQLIERGQELSSGTAKAVTVRFPVLSAQRKGVTDPKGQRTELWFLSSDKDPRVVDPNVFHVEISASAEAALKESGVSDIPGHFVGKTVAVTGRVRAAVIDVFSEPETILAFSIKVGSPDQILADDDGTSELVGSVKTARQPNDTSKGRSLSCHSRGEHGRRCTRSRQRSVLAPSTSEI